MQEPQRKQAKITDISRVENLLEIFKGLSQHDPSPALRERLKDISSQRLRKAVDARWRPFTRLWLRPVFATAVLIAVGLSAALVVHLRHRKPQANHSSEVSRAEILPGKEALNPPLNAPTAQLPKARLAKLPKTHDSAPMRRPSPKMADSSSRQMMLRLPYSNSAVVTGTGTTLRVSMSQSELLSLGFPINTTLHDRRIVAELTLGADGLPRAISLPLPLEIMKEKR